MTPKTLKALKSSVAKWRSIADGVGYSAGPDNCPLCKLFYQNDCKGCPVFQLTNRQGCVGTPYAAWEGLDEGDGYHTDTNNGEEGHAYAISDVAKLIAIAEANFLRALLPANHR